jgi:hypothetical protein
MSNPQEAMEVKTDSGLSVVTYDEATAYEVANKAAGERIRESSERMGVPVPDHAWELMSPEERLLERFRQWFYMQPEAAYLMGGAERTHRRALGRRLGGQMGKIATTIPKV